MSSQREGGFSASMDTSIAGKTDPDHVLAQRAGTDLEAFGELYRRYQCHIFRFVRSQTPDDATAEDLTAHVFFKALSSADTFRADGSYRAWLFRIAHNAVLSYRTLRDRSLAVGQPPEEVDPDPSPASQAITQEARGLVWQAVARLPESQRELVALRYMEDMSIEEIASITQRTKGSIRIQLHRARMNLRDAFEGKDLL